MANSVVLKSKHGQDVIVTHSVSMTREHLHVIDVVAFCGPIREARRATFGADDGPRRVLTPEAMQAELQQQLDTERQTAANEAGFKEAIRTAIQNLT